MRGAALPAALAFAALALALGFVPRRTAVLALLLAIGIAAGVSFFPVPEAGIEAVFLGCWGSIIAVALCVYLPRPPLVPGLAAIVGIVAGLVIAAQGVPTDLLRALPAALLVVPASVAVERGYGIAPRVVASWLIAVALLAAIIPHVVTHPGYVPDHME